MSRQHKKYQELIQNKINQAEYEFQENILKHFLDFTDIIKGVTNNNEYDFRHKFQDYYKIYSIQKIQQSIQQRDPQNQNLNKLNQLIQDCSQLTDSYNNDIDELSRSSNNTQIFFDEDSLIENPFYTINQRLINIQNEVITNLKKFQIEENKQSEIGTIYTGITPSFDKTIKLLKQVEKLFEELQSIQHSQFLDKQNTQSISHLDQTYIENCQTNVS
ncbi:hypothetical protein ABPG74_010888 [Tetrahymena malaccensis]